MIKCVEFFIVSMYVSFIAFINLKKTYKAVVLKLTNKRGKNKHKKSSSVQLQVIKALHFS